MRLTGLLFDPPRGAPHPVVFFFVLALSKLGGEILTANLVGYNTMEVHSVDTLP